MSEYTRHVMVMNGAGIKTHDSFERALRQARQWKASHLDRKVWIETLQMSPPALPRLVAVVYVELPMLVPEQTPRHDFEDGSGVR